MVEFESGIEVEYGLWGYPHPEKLGHGQRGFILRPKDERMGFFGWLQKEFRALVGNYGITRAELNEDCTEIFVFLSSNDPDADDEAAIGLVKTVSEGFLLPKIE